MTRKAYRALCSVFMAFMISNIPHIAAADAAVEMIPTSVVVEELSRAQAISKIQNTLDRKEIKEELVKRGVSVEEVNQRLASLSDQELKQLAGQMDAALYGGDPVTGILVVVVLVLLIIFLAKRI